MPAIYRMTSRVRTYECDAYGHLNNVNYIRLMQEAAIEASAAVGWDMARYAAVGQHWLIRETDIEYLRPFLYGDTIEITTWVEDFRRVRSRRIYEFRKEGETELYARAVTDWVYLDRQTKQLAAIPESMIADFAPDGDVAVGTPRTKFPAPAAPASEVFTLRKRVEWRDIDMEGHANNAAYVGYLEDLSTQVGRHYKWPMQRLIDSGTIIILRQLRLVYHQPAYMDEEVDIQAWLSDMRRVSVVRHYRMERVGDGALLAQARGLWVSFDLHKQRLTSVSKEMMDDFAPNVSKA
jgi:acyl-CoA thioester hydrolase